MLGERSLSEELMTPCYCRFSQCRTFSTSLSHALRCSCWFHIRMCWWKGERILAGKGDIRVVERRSQFFALNCVGCAVNSFANIYGTKFLEKLVRRRENSESFPAVEGSPRLHSVSSGKTGDSRRLHTPPKITGSCMCAHSGDSPLSLTWQYLKFTPHSRRSS